MATIEDPVEQNAVIKLTDRLEFLRLSKEERRNLLATSSRGNASTLRAAMRVC